MNKCSCYIRKDNHGAYKARVNINLGPKKKMKRIQFGLSTKNHDEAIKKAEIIIRVLKKLGVYGDYQPTKK